MHDRVARSQKTPSVDRLSRLTQFIVKTLYREIVAMFNVYHHQGKLLAPWSIAHLSFFPQSGE